MTILLLAAAATMALPAVWASSPQLRVQRQATDIVSTLRMTRAAAIRLNRDMDVAIDIRRRVLASPATITRPLDPQIEIAMSLAPSEQRTASAGGIRFFPNGQSSGGEIHLRLRGAQSRVVVNWATGYAGVTR
ncbi:MAG: GspH/FimT family pseudopilin [Hyphomicrobiales bacterium]|nr:GspH/FimT family pseudopilin [Hyphomicrobiales bacterium]